MLLLGWVLIQESALVQQAKEHNRQAMPKPRKSSNISSKEAPYRSKIVYFAS
jgi:hypothetical protein